MTLALGGGRYLTPRDLFSGRPSRGMPARDLADWKAYWELDPFGETRADMRNASAQDAVLAPYRPKNYDGPRITPFYPYVRPEETEELDHEACWAHLQEARRAAAGSAPETSEEPGQ